MSDNLLSNIAAIGDAKTALLKNGTTVDISAAVGPAWDNSAQGKINLLAYTPTGDGSINDAPAIQLALDDISAVPHGATLYIPDATDGDARYRVEQPLTLFGSNVALEGAGKYTTELVNRGDFFGPILYVGPDWGGVPTQASLSSGPGAAMTLDGTGDYYLVPSDAHTVTLAGLSTCTVEFKFLLNSDPSSTSGVMSCQGALYTGMAAPDFGEQFDHTFTFRLQAATEFGGPPGQSAIITGLNVNGTFRVIDTGFLGTPFYVANGVIHHGALTYNGSAVKLWVDGVEIASVSASGPLTQYLHTTWTIGTGLKAWPENIQSYKMISGAVDSVRISNVCRYTTTFTPFTTKPTWDTNTVFLHNFDNQQGIFSVALARQSAASGVAVPLYIVTRKALGAIDATSGVTLRNLRFSDASGDGVDSCVFFQSSTNFEVSSCYLGTGLKFLNNCFEGLVANNVVAGGGLTGLSFNIACGAVVTRDCQIIGSKYQYVASDGGGLCSGVTFVPSADTIQSIIQKSTTATLTDDSVCTFEGCQIDDESTTDGVYEAAASFSAMNVVNIVGGNWDVGSVSAVPPLQVDGGRKVTAEGVGFVVFDDSQPISVLNTPTKPLERISFEGCAPYKANSNVPWCDSAGYAMVDGHVGGTFTVSDGNTSPTPISLGITEPDNNYRVQITPLSKTGSPAAGSNLIDIVALSTTTITPVLTAAPGSGNSRTFMWDYSRSP